MTIDLAAAKTFLATSGRLLDWRRLLFLIGEDDADGVLRALDAYRNADGGYGWSFEADLRSPESQPTAAMHAFEVLDEVGAHAGTRGVELCDWLQRHSSEDGALPFVRPISETTACAPWWAGGDTSAPSLMMTAQVAGNAHRHARHDPAVAEHPWLTAATRWCLDAIGALTEPHAYELMFSVLFLDAAAGTVAEAQRGLDSVRRFVPADGAVAVEGGVEGEQLHPLDFAPHPGPARELFTAEVVQADMDRLASQQQPDGGWVVDFASFSPAAALEWRGYATVAAIRILHAS